MRGIKSRQEESGSSTSVDNDKRQGTGVALSAVVQQGPLVAERENPPPQRPETAAPELTTALASLLVIGDSAIASSAMRKMPPPKVEQGDGEDGVARPLPQTEEECNGKKKQQQ